MLKNKKLYVLIYFFIFCNILSGSDLKLQKSVDIFYDGYTAKLNGDYKTAANIFSSVYVMDTELKDIAKKELLESVIKSNKYLYDSGNYKKVEKNLRKFEVILNDEIEFCALYGLALYELNKVQNAIIYLRKLNQVNQEKSLLLEDLVEINKNYLDIKYKDDKNLSNKLNRTRDIFRSFLDKAELKYYIIPILAQILIVAL